MSGGYLSSSLLPSGGQSLLDEVFAGVKDANPNTSFEETKKDKLTAPTYNAKVDITPQQGQQATQRGTETPMRENYGPGGAPHGPPGQQSPTDQQLTPEQMTNLRKKFMWVLENSPSNRDTFSSQAVLDRALNDPSAMINIIDRFENAVHEQSKQAQQAQQAQQQVKRVEINEKANTSTEVNTNEPFIDNNIDTRTTFQRIWDIINLPLLLAIAFYFLISPNTINQILIYMPFLANFEGLRVFFLAFVFFIISIITRQTLTWLSN